MLSEERKLDREDMRKMQLDIKDLSVNDLKVLLNSYYKNKRLSANWELMRNWDGILTPGRQQAIFYKCFRRSVRLATDEVSRSLAVRTGPRYDQFMHFLAGNYSLSYAGAQFDSRHYFDRIVVMADSLYATIKQRPDFNPYAFTIPQMTYLPGLDVDVKDIGGSDNTINVNHGVHPVVRTLIEINGDSIQSWMVNATGQTGRFNSRNYLQQFNAWKANDLHKTQFTTSPDQLKCISTTIFIGH
jgi:acyl-homoserine lactone acylase PvdQ